MDIFPTHLPSPAKINRFLHVINKRTDGYHQIETLIQFLEFSDTLLFEAIEQPKIVRVDQHEYKLPDEDLIVRAAKLLQSEYPKTKRHGIRITLNKVIPPGSGLGGGSSNAATTLWALNHLWRLAIPRHRLATLGLQLGADVPVFVHGHAAFVSGIGEQIEIRDPAERWLCICLPPIMVSTSKVFAHFDRRHLDGKYHNHLEPVATSLYPPIKAALACLRNHADSRMSGSGCAVYADFSTREQAEEIAAKLPDELDYIITRTCNHHPLRDFGLRPGNKPIFC